MTRRYTFECIAHIVTSNMFGNSGSNSQHPFVPRDNSRMQSSRVTVSVDDNNRKMPARDTTRAVSDEQSAPQQNESSTDRGVPDSNPFAFFCQSPRRSSLQQAARAVPGSTSFETTIRHDETEEDRRHREVNDEFLAASLQQQDFDEKENRRKAELDSMAQTLDGRAWLIVNEVLDLHRRLESSAPGLTPVSVDDMVFLAKRFLECQADFQSNAWPSHVTIAYHYTKWQHMDSIKEDGLMSLADRYHQYGNASGVGVYGKCYIIIMTVRSRCMTRY